MYLTEKGFSISVYELIIIIMVIIIGVTILKVLTNKILYNINKRNDMSDYNSLKFSDTNKEIELNLEKQDKMIFEEIISGVSFRYDEKTRILTIGERLNNPIEVKLEKFSDLREFIDRLEEYIYEN